MIYNIAITIIGDDTMEFKLKKQFLMGTASAATQIEGGDTDTNWLQFYREGGIKDGTSPQVADDHWRLWESDTLLMGSMGMQICRFGIEWGRIVPEEGKVDTAVLERYRKEIELMLKLGIKPLLTIHHFSNPMWFERKGGWVKRENNRYFLELVEIVVKSFGDLVSEYITINEPNVFATNCYCFGVWYPQHRSLSETFAVLENFAYCHIKAYEMIHSARKAMGYTDTKVGFANHLRPFDPKNPKNPVHVGLARLGSWCFQGAITEAMTLGRFKLPLIDHWGVEEGEYTDFNGINYYSRSVISGLQDGIKENSPRNDLDWEIYPEGLERCGLYLTKLLPRPIYITENGTCDNSDSFRARYLFEHLKAVSESPLPFERYYHWCFTDNFEWAEGQSARFGLVHVDYDTQERAVKRSGEFFTEIIENGGVTEDMYRRYVAGEEYRIK